MTSGAAAERVLNPADRADFPIFRGLGVRVAHLFFFSKGVLESWYYEAPSGALMLRSPAKTSLAALRDAADDHLRAWPASGRARPFALLRVWEGTGVEAQAVTHARLVAALGREGDAERRRDWHSVQLLIPPESPAAAADGAGTVYRVRMQRHAPPAARWEVRGAPPGRRSPPRRPRRLSPQPAAGPPTGGARSPARASLCSLT
jgi:hypothetical protein